MGDLEMETKLITIVAPTTPTWAVFAAEEGDDGEVWTERVHLWAHTRAALPPDRAADEEFLGNEVPPARSKIQGMVLCGGDLVLTRDTNWLLLGYSEDETPRTEDWADRIKVERRLFARKMC